MKTKNFFLIGAIMLATLMTYIFLGLFISEIDVWHYTATWIMFYIYLVIVFLAFLVHIAFKANDFMKRVNGSRTDSLSGILGGIGCALFSFGLGFFWYMLNHPLMDLPFDVSVEITRAIYAVYAIITIVVILSAIALKIVALTIKRQR